ncbi:MAG: hypothetical protein P8J32_06540 [bacterium]|nr:hypothetical protein [bacterium]
MAYGTGDTIYQHIVSTDSNNNVVSGATFDNRLYRNGALYTGATLNFSLADAPRGVYVASFSASTIGEYQIYSDNITTNTIYISDILSVKSAEDISTSIYIGF